MTRLNTPVVWIAAYALVAVVTFGHAWVNAPAERYSFVLGKPLPTDQADRLFGGSLAAIGWPFYWSVVAWEKNDRDIQHCTDLHRLGC